jgi:peptidyl-tRNA hydrolase, PTH2 family
MFELKQVILVRNDLKLPKGKLAAQASHASVEAVLKSDRSKVKEWHDFGQKKIVLKVADEKELIKFFQKAKELGFTASLITDAGKTVVAPGTKTCVGIGPDNEDEIDKLTGNLKMM